ncbi:MAG: aspartate carbamoyltransferase catalytic subunit [Lachnospirales bacterium]
MYNKKDLVGLKDLSKAELEHFLDLAVDMKKAVLDESFRCEDYSKYSAMTLFYEDSTRTKMSFLLACEYLGVKVVDLNVGSSSKNKGESLLDTALNVDVMGTNLVIMRHSTTGAPHFLGNNMKASVISGGDGANEHPTQALLDIFTMKEKFGKIEGLKVVIVGDVKHSRVARSNAYALLTLGANVTFVGPTTYVPDNLKELGVTISHNLKESVINADVIMALRVQHERHKISEIPSVSEYAKFFRVSDEIVALAKDNCLVMHPGPINRNVEITNSCADGEKSVILEQVTNGVAIRMSIIKTLLDTIEERRNG